MQPYELLEKKWSEFNDLNPAGMVACSSGTAALHLALEALQLPLGSKCICPDFTMIACARSVVLAGLTPVFVDCGGDLLMDDGDLMIDAIVEPYSAFMAVHIYGRRVDMDWISSTAGACHPVVEDLAEAHGIRPHEGTDAACWSFYRNKIVAGEEGGAVWFKNPQAACLARQLRSLGFTEAHDFNHIPRGHNYRMSNAHASPILESLEHYDDNLKARRWIESTFERECPENWKMPKRDVPWVYDLRIKGMTSENQDSVVKALNQAGIAARHAFKPMHEQEEFKDCWFIKSSYCSRSSYFATSVLYLPIQQGVTTEVSIVKAFAILRDFFPE